MKNRKFCVILMAVIMVIAGGCGNKVETNNPVEDVMESTSGIEENAAENLENERSDVDEGQGFHPVIIEKEDSELNLKDYHDYLEDKTLLTDDEAFRSGNFEFAEDVYFQTTEKIPMYASNGVRTGYIKEDVSFSVIAVCEDWCYFYLRGDDKRYARLSEIEAGSLGPEELDAISAQRMAEDMAKAQPQSQTAAPAEQNPVQETVPNTAVEEPVEVPVESDKYTPEEAIAVYRSLMEAGGMTWDSSLKGNWDETIGQYPIEEWNLHLEGYNGCGWGTGWIYLDKGQPEWAASTNLESAAIGGHGGNSWTRFYFEVTGSDENAVYITEWTSN